MTPKLVYIAGPYRAATPWLVEQNIRHAEQLAMKVAVHGAYPVCPHTNTRGHFEGVQPSEFWLQSTLELMRRCDAVVLVRHWLTSSGARAEREESCRLGLPVFEELDIGDARWCALLGQTQTVPPPSGEPADQALVPDGTEPTQPEGAGNLAEAL